MRCLKRLKFIGGGGGEVSVLGSKSKIRQKFVGKKTISRI